jgi:hypothetical protein
MKGYMKKEVKHLQVVLCVFGFYPLASLHAKAVDERCLNKLGAYL